MIEKTVEEYLLFAKKRMGLSDLDALYAKNRILALLGIQEPYSGELSPKAGEERVPDRYEKEFASFLVEQKGMELAEAERKVVEIFGLATPSPSLVAERFKQKKAQSPQEALDYLYALGIASGYYQKTKVDQNLVYDAPFPDGPSLEISINLSKPEKNNKDIAKLVHAAPSGYPLCLLCKENLGFGGDFKRPARENIRIVPLELDGEKWYLQYSPYGYFYQHCILVYDHHEPMEMNRRILSKLLSFVDQFPCFFIGSNSDLPIVGGSILNHEHFQGGKHLLPLFLAPARSEIPCPLFPSCRLEEIDFYDTVLRVSGPSKKEVLDLGERILQTWRNYDDPACQILSKDETGQHSTVTPLARKVDGGYQLYLILRNNRCNEKYPGGIFHAHPEYAHVKQEGIGLIEAAGLFILPARLKRQSAEVEEYVKEGLSHEEILSRYPELSLFGDMIESLSKDMTTKEYLAEVCRKILGNVAVYKKDEEGHEGLSRFLRKVEK